MSWFDAAQITTFASKAIKEAQKTLDKALDIQEGDEQEQDKHVSGWTSTWRRTSKSDQRAGGGEDAAKETPPPASVWGSFSGSLFDVAKKDPVFSASSSVPATVSETLSAAPPPVSVQPRKGSTSRDSSRAEDISRGHDSQVAKAEQQQQDVCSMGGSTTTLGHMVIGSSSSSSLLPEAVRASGKNMTSSSSSSILEGESETEFLQGMDIVSGEQASLSPLVSSWEEGSRFSTSRLVVSSSPEETYIQVPDTDSRIFQPSSTRIEEQGHRPSSQQTFEEAADAEQKAVAPAEAEQESVETGQKSPDQISAGTSQELGESGSHSFETSQDSDEVEKYSPGVGKESTDDDKDSTEDDKDSTDEDKNTSEAGRNSVKGGAAPDSTEDEAVSDEMETTAGSPGSTSRGPEQAGSTRHSGCSSADLISPSIEVISPSSIEVISPGGDDFWGTSSQKEECKAVEELESSVSSERTLVEGDTLALHTEEHQESAGSIVTQLYDAMGDVEHKSSAGSSQSSDIVKLECNSYESGWCEELEAAGTSNSSDVEVLSSPGLPTRLRGAAARPGSSGSDVSSGSAPVADVLRGPGGPCHSRNMSDQSLPEDVDQRLRTEHHHQRLMESHREEMSELRKKNSDLSELLQARETRLLAMAREIAQVQEESGQMAVRLELALKQTDVERGSAESFRGELERQRCELEAERKKGGDQERELERLRRLLRENSGTNQEQDEIIADLRLEGEALAKQNGKQAEIIRKLRAKEKTTEAEVKKYRADTDRLTGEVERLKKELAGREEAGLGLANTLKSLTEANQAWEADSRKMRADLEDSEEKVRGLRSSLETAYREMAEMKRNLDEARDEATAAALDKETAARKEAERTLEDRRISWEAERSELEGRLTQLQVALTLSERSAGDREAASRREVELMRGRLEDSELRNQDLAESISQASKPLLRQVESLQAALRESQEAGERVELLLTERLRQVTAAMAGAQERERSVAEQYSQASARLAALEAQAAKAGDLRSEVEERAAQLARSLEAAQEERSREGRLHEAAALSLRNELAELRRERDFLSASLESEKLEGESRRKKSLALMEQLKERDRRVRELQVEMETRVARESLHSSPSPSLSHLSTTGSELFSREPWAEDVLHFTNSTVAAPPPALYDTVRHASTAAVVESLQAQLKMREGEILQLQSEILHSERLREAMAVEMTKLTEQAEQGEVLRLQMEEMGQEVKDLQQKYQTMLTMYGEKVEEAEELRLDLLDVKEMYKTQIDQLMALKGE